MADEPQIEETPVEETPVAEAVPESWAPSREEFEQLTKFQQAATPILSQLSEILSDPEVQRYEQPTAEAPEIDPFDPESLKTYFSYAIEQKLQETMAPFEGILGMVAAEKGEALAREELGRIQEQVGDFDRDAAFLIGSGLIERGVNPQQALTQAAEFTNSFEKRIRESERAKVLEELKELGGSPQEIAPQGTASATEIEKIPTGPNRYQEAVERVLRSRRPSFPVG